VVEVDIGALVEAMVGWFLRRRGHVVVHVSEAVLNLVHGLKSQGGEALTASRAILHPAAQAFSSCQRLVASLVEYIQSLSCEQPRGVAQQLRRLLIVSTGSARACVWVSLYHLAAARP
jgi:hypothetical protein